jgi:hypothetical protein
VRAILILSSAAPRADQRRPQNGWPDPERVSEAERQVREAEERLARQLVLIRRLKIAGCDDDADEIAYQRGVPGAAARRQHPVHYHEAVMSRVDLRIDASWQALLAICGVGSIIMIVFQ